VKRQLRDLLADAVRFAGIGALNALLTTALYQVLLFWLNYTWAFSIAWLSGLVFISIAYPKVVFKTGKAGPYRILANAAYYGASFFLSLWALDRFSQVMSERLAVFAMLAVITPLNFIVSRYIFRHRGRPTPSPVADETAR
jgi:putative flippase GtrA